MASLVFNASIKLSFRELLLSIKPYMKGVAYDKIIVKEQGRFRFELTKQHLNYTLFGCNVNTEMIDKFICIK